jgi:hypothetical protein
MRHGPHQGAQKSTRTGWSLERTSRWNVAWDTSGSALMIDSVPRQEETARRGARLHVRFRRAAGPVTGLPRGARRRPGGHADASNRGRRQLTRGIRTSTTGGPGRSKRRRASENLRASDRGASVPLPDSRFVHTQAFGDLPVRPTATRMIQPFERLQRP